MIELSTCPACGDAVLAADPLRRIDCRQNGSGTLSVRLTECACGHVFINPQPSWEELAPFYRSDYHVFHDPVPDDATVDRLIAEKHRGDRLNHARVVQGGRYLDVGCGLGMMVAGMARLGMQAEGVEPGEAAVEKVRGLGLKVFHGMLHDARYPDASFDSVSMYHVLEHTPDPVVVLAECRRILKPGGELFVGVPNFDSLVRTWIGWLWSGLDLPRHLHQFRADSFRLAARRAGLEVVRIETESLPEHVERELAGFLRQRALVPRRFTLKSRVTLPLAGVLARKGNASGRGESLNVHLRRDDS